MKKILNLIFMLSAALFIAAPVYEPARQLVSSFPMLIAPGIAGMVYGAFTHFMSLIAAPNVAGAIQKEIWEQYIADNLFKGIEFLKNCFRADEYVLNGRVVHIPNAGAVPVVTKNRSAVTAPVTVVNRTDADVTYNIDEYTTAPSRIPNADKVELSYSKIDSILGNHIGALNEAICDNILIAWSPSLAANIIRTTGGAIAAHVTNGTPATGNRKLFKAADLKAAKVKMDKMKVSKLNRYAAMTPDMWSQLETDLAAISTRDFSRYEDAEKGEIRMLYGFEIIVTPLMPTWNNAGTPVVQSIGYAGATTDNDGVLCWQKDAVEMALGEIKFFELLNDPTYYGDVYSALVRMGGRKRLASDHAVTAMREVGVVAIVQDASA